MRVSYMIGVQYEINPWELEPLKGEFVGYIHTDKDPTGFPVFKLRDYYRYQPEGTDNRDCLMVLRNGRHVASGATVPALMADFQRQFHYVGSEHKTIRVGGGEVSRDEFTSQARAAGVSDKVIQASLERGGYQGEQNYHGEIKWCPDCKVIRQTSCCACGCGSCKTCNRRWTCMPPIDLSSIPTMSLNSLVSNLSIASVSPAVSTGSKG